MRVAVVCPYDLGALGGVQDQATALVGWLGEAGHEAWLVGPGTTGPEGSRLVGPITVVTANGALTPITLSPAAWRRTAESVRGADIVHIHEPFMPIVSQSATAVPGVAKVGTFHADPSRLVRRLYRVAGPVLRRIAERLTVATAVSPVAAAPLRELVHTRLVPNGIDVAAFSTGPKAPGTVAFLGRDDPRKGLDVLLAAWPNVLARVPGARLVVAGSKRPPREGVDFLGPVGEAEKLRVLARSEVFCAPNTRGESFGIVLAEAMASGCALVASAMPAFVNVAGPAADLVRPGDPRALADALVTLLTNSESRHSLVSAALERVQRFDRRTVLDGYLSVYEEAIAIAAR